MLIGSARCNLRPHRPWHTPAMIDQLRAAVDALDQGDPEPFAALIAEDNEWRGVTQGFLWWKQVPECHGPTEAREVLNGALRSREGEHLLRDVEFTQVGDNKVIGSAQWLAPDGKRRRRFQVLTFRDGKIVDMQGCSTRREAERFARSA